MSITMYQNNVARLTKDVSDLEKQAGDEIQKIARWQSDIVSINRSITRSTTLSMQRMKWQQVASKQDDIGRARKRLADIQSRLYMKLAELHRNQQSLQRAQEQEQRKQDAEAKKRRDEELRHMKQVTQEIERQSRIHSQLTHSHSIGHFIDVPITEDIPEYERKALGDDVENELQSAGPPSDTPPDPRNGRWDNTFDWYYSVGKLRRMTVRELAQLLGYSHSYVQHKKNEYDTEYGRAQKDSIKKHQS